MSKELVIGSNRHETKVAILEEDQLVEVYFQRANEYSLAGSIHKGRVTRVLPGMQSAFVDLGLERDTFLYVSDFFEENDDIDTVSDEKPAPFRNERRERGPMRQPERSPEPVEMAEPFTEPDVADERSTALGEEGLPVAVLPYVTAPPPIAAPPVVNPTTSAPPGGQATGTQGAGIQGGDSRSSSQPNDRADGGFRGDRRGRRSRRRRPRGNGIPDTKYAQPGDARSASEAGPSDEAEFEPEQIQVSEPREVIILPGESLAKYRHLAASPAPEEDEPEVAFQPNASAFDAKTIWAESSPAESAANDEQFDHDVVVEDEAATEEELEAEAQELELVDRILSHHDETPAEVEEKFAEVRNDQPVSPFVVDDLESEEEPPADEEVHLAEASAEDAPGSAFGESHSASYPAADMNYAESSRPFEDGPGLLSTSEYVEVQNELIDEDFESEEPEFLEPAGSAAPMASPETNMSGPGISTEGEEPAPVQTAMVREQNGRSMHRVSRRMRRRRGGNRFGQPQQEGGTENRVAGSATGAAPALQAEPRPEIRREAPVPEAKIEKSTERPERVMPSITELLKAGQEIIVQIAKEPLGQKGARITSHVALPGRFVVFMPSVAHLGVSRKIASDEERQRLKRILQAHRAGTTGGFIVRTAGEGVPEEEIAADMDFLYKLWLDIRQKAEKKPAPTLLHYDLDIVQRILRDQVTDEFKAIWVDNEEMYENVLSFMQRFQPALVNRVKMYTRSAPIYDAFGITQELEKALRPKVWLKSGGYIVINQTEALVAIDINTGKYVGKSNRLEDTIVKTNTEAVKEIVRQIRLRDLGGIIVVDFIDMDERKNRQKVMQALEEAMRADKAPYKILQFNDFGLVAITRKRVKQSLERTLCSPCPYCEGAGYVKSVQTVIGEILIEAQKLSKAIEGKDVLLRVHPEVAKVLKANDNRYLEELEEILGRPVMVKGDPALHTEKFDLG